MINVTLLRLCLLATMVSTPAAAQWQVPNNSVPIGRGSTASGFKNALPTASGGCPLVSTGSASNPAFTCGYPVTWSAFHKFSSGTSTGANNTWVNTYLPGSIAAGNVASFVVSPNGGYSASLSATRGSDRTGPKDNVISNTALAVNDNSTVAHNYWARYDQVNIQAGALSALVLGVENSIQNSGPPTLRLDPFNTLAGTAIPNTVANIKFTNGVGLGPATSSQIGAAVLFGYNGGQYYSGMIFAADSLDTSGGVADAMSFGPNHSLTWYNATSQPGWQIFANSNAGSGKIIMGNNTFDIYLSSTPLLPLHITTTQIALGYATSVNGVMSATSFSIGGVTALNRVGNYTILADANGGAPIQAGNATDPTTFYKQDAHRFQSRNAATTFGSFTSAGLDLTTGVYKANGVSGVSCSAGAFNSATAVVTNGIITHC